MSVTIKLDGRGRPVSADLTRTPLASAITRARGTCYAMHQAVWFRG